ncbi:MAG: crossover junction endodeoxyribonuclease RuvC [Alphaproteobacteria bacterium]
MCSKIRLIGVDPGLRRTGWGVIEVEGSHMRHIAHGVVAPDPDLEMAERLVILHAGLGKVARAHGAVESAVEETFINTNAKASLKLGQARGVVLVALAGAGLPVAEYSPNRIKKSVVGSGHAQKPQIRMMIEILLGKPGVTNDDAADALAVAITHAHFRRALAPMATS